MITSQMRTRLQLKFRTPKALLTMTSIRHHVLTILIFAAIVSMTGCRVGPTYTRPAATATPPPVSYKESAATTEIDSEGNSWKPASPSDAMLRGKWWEIFGNPELNGLEDKLNIDNQNIRVAFENFMAARTLIAQARATLYPTVSVGPAFTRSRTSENLRNTTSTAAGITGGSGTTSSVAQLPLDVSWEPDLFGKIRNTIRANQYNAQLSAADLEDERLAEQANLAMYYFELRGQDALEQIYQQTITEYQRSLDYNKAQYDLGIGDRISVVEAENTLQSAKATAINLRVARAQYEHAIAMLIGVSASNFSLPVKPLLLSAPAIPIGVPSQLLERRPDIAAAERTMAAANAQIGVAVAAYYPSLTLSMSGGLESSSFKHLFDISSRYWSVGPSASETIFDAGLRRATVRQYIYTYNADVASYRQTVLTAFQQVEDYLASVRYLSDQIHEQEQAQASAREYVTLQTSRYQTGIDPYVNVVTAQTTLLSDQQQLATLHIQQMTAAVQLIEALGGGWDVSQLPTVNEVSEKLSNVNKVK